MLRKAAAQGLQDTFTVFIINSNHQVLRGILNDIIHNIPQQAQHLSVTVASLPYP
jgi:hypothetical protein